MRRFLAGLSLTAAVLFSSPARPGFSKRDLAYYADPEVINFVRPGLAIKLVTASISADGTIQTQFTLTDPQGLALDRAGVNTPGAVATTFLAAFIPKGQSDYISLIARPTTGAVSGTVNQPVTDADRKSVV